MRNRDTVSIDRRQFLGAALAAALAGKAIADESSKI